MARTEGHSIAAALRSVPQSADSGAGVQVSAYLQSATVQMLVSKVSPSERNVLC